ncbi:DUF1963 domain-containing protein [Nocardiopsis changdeensis]|uniref:DUF1963 domain-containing protein n=1 Tax=Nocardiopsis changdeensis TaxID=2831969 RepID=UPI003F44BE40
MEALFPELTPFRRDTIRLHPRPGRPSPHDSSVGGPLLWPAEEIWPVCRQEHYLRTFSGERYYDESEVYLVPIVQIHRKDVPALPFPEGRDLLQVMWCPFQHVGLYCPEPRVFWRDSRTVEHVAEAPSPDENAPEQHIPRPCVIHPETVQEYPSQDLPKEIKNALRNRFEKIEEEKGWSYHYHLSEVPGIKLGGYPGWTQDPLWPECQWCERQMEHLLTVSSWEYDGESWRTWLPAEDRETDSGEEGWRAHWNKDAHSPTGMTLGDAGGVYIFECRSCPERPMDYRFDCS